MAHAAVQKHHSSFGSFLFSTLVIIAALAVGAFWMGQKAPPVRVSELRPAISIPMPRLPAPPGVIPRAAAPHS